MKNTIFLIISLKHVTGLTGRANPTGTQKLWQITHKNGHKHKNDKFFVITLKHMLGLMVFVNRPRTAKLWAIAHENSHRTQKQRFSGHISQTCKGSYEACKSA